MDAKEALELLQQAEDYWAENYNAFKEDVRFSIGLDHWTDAEIKRRGASACLVVPVLPQYIHQVVNDMRMNTPSINVIPASEGAAEETASVLKEWIRSIEYKSGADEIYDTAGEYAVRGGFGFARVDHDYISEDSFLQELRLLRVQNPESVYLDPNYTECDGSDAEWGIVLDKISKKEFERRYKGKEFKSFSTKEHKDDDKVITIAEVFIKKYTTITKALDDEGNIEELQEDDAEGEGEPDDAPAQKKGIRKKRVLKKVTICRYRFSGSELLEETTFPGKYIPIVPFLGEEVWVDGKRYLLSLIRQAKDAQRRLNKWVSKESEILDMAPISPVMAPVGSVEDFMDEWGSPGEVNVMRYRTMDAAGNPLPAPQRLQPPQASSATINATQGARENVKEALGMYNASVGQRSNAISGVAYNAQKVEADVATFHFGDNRNRSIEQIGRILISARKEVMDTPRVIQVIGSDEKPKMVGINGRLYGDQKEHHYFSEEEYDVRVTTGASYTTKRQESNALFGELIKGNPQLLQVFGDLWAGTLDVAGADAIADRIKKTIPPALLEGEDGKEPVDPRVQQMAQALQQSQAQIQQMGAALESKQGDLQIKAAEVEVKQQELALKQAEIQLKAQQMMQPKVDANEAEKMQFEQAVAAKELELKERAQALDEAEFQLKTAQAMQASPELAKTAEDYEQEALEEQMRSEEEAQDRAIRDAQAQAVLQAMGAIVEQINALTAQIARPKTVIRDAETGAIVGVQ